jgi:hypothetical protein
VVAQRVDRRVLLAEPVLLAEVVGANGEHQMRSAK